jgi:hypothetical protein
MAWASEMHTTFLLGNLKWKDQLGDLAADEMITLRAERERVA